MAHKQTYYRPVVSGGKRASQALARGSMASFMAEERPALSVPSNEEDSLRFTFVTAASFTKGLPHNSYGIADRDAYERFVMHLTSDTTGDAIPTGCPEQDFRGWDGGRVGMSYTVRGTDVANIALAPAPRVGYSEVIAELAELYAMALVRDVPFRNLHKADTPIGYYYPSTHPDKPTKAATIGDVVEELKKLAWNDSSRAVTSSYPGASGKGQLTSLEHQRRQARWSSPDDGHINVENLFSGLTGQSHGGTYLSQFLYIGTGNRGGSITNTPSLGLIDFGAQTIDQRIAAPTPGIDFMTDWHDWLRSQNGAAEMNEAEGSRQKRFIATPRDLAAYCRFDPSHQAFVNACLVLLQNKAPLDPGLQGNDRNMMASWGFTEINRLLADAAAQATKAVRRQQFQIHRRGRPESLAAMLCLEANGKGEHLKEARAAIQAMLGELGAGQADDISRPGILLDWVSQLNAANNARRGSNVESMLPTGTGSNYLLPMAWPDGAPMAPSYGSLRAAIAGACVTVIKAVFEMTTSYVRATGAAEAYIPSEVCGDILEVFGTTDGLTLEDELNKLASNMAFGDKFAGVHYYSDCHESLRLGECLAVAILQEHMLEHSIPRSMSLTGFDGERITLATNGRAASDSARVYVETAGEYEPASPPPVWTDMHDWESRLNAWWTRSVVDFEDPMLDIERVEIEFAMPQLNDRLRNLTA